MRGVAGRGGPRWIAERWLVLAAGAAASIPIVVAAVRAVADGWVPLGDTAYTGVNALDVFSGHPPLVGQWSSGATAAVEEPAYSPGPLLFWLLAIPARLPEPSLMIVTMGLVNLAAVIGTLALARRRGGLALMFAVAIAIAAMLGSLAGEAHADIWNSSAGLLPLTLLVFLAWSLACGEYALLPVTALVASFLAQSHLTFAAPALGATAVGLVGLALSGRAPRRWVLAALAVALVCWSAPLVEQATERPGNLVLLVRAAFADDPSAGLETGWHALVRAVGVVPWWLQDPDTPVRRAAQLREDPGALSTVTTLLVLAGLAAAAVAGWRRRRFDVVAAGALALVLCAALVQVAASTPLATFDTLGYTLRWSSPAGMCIWIVLGWSGWVLLAPARPRPAPARGLAIGAVAAVAAVATVVAAAAVPRPDPYSEMSAISDGLESRLPPEGSVRVDARITRQSIFLAFMFQAGIVYALRHDGRDVTAPSIAIGMGDEYDREDADHRLRVEVGRPLEPDGRTLARVRARDPFVEGARVDRLVAVKLLGG